MSYYFLPLILAVCTVFLVNFKTDLSAFVISGNNSEEILLASEMQSGTLSRRYLLSISKKESQAISAGFIQSFTQNLKDIDGVVDVWMPDQQANISQTIQNLYSGYANSIYSLNAEKQLPSLFSEQGLKQRAQLIKTVLLSPQGALFKPTILKDPLLLTLNGFQALGSQMQTVMNKDNRYQNWVLETGMAGLDTFHQAEIQTHINCLFAELNKSDQYLLEMTGVPIFAVATQTLMQGDVVKVSLISSLVLTIIFLLLFRSFGAMFKVFTLLIIVILSSILITQLIFGYVHGITIAMGATLVGICIDYPIHAIVHAQSVKVADRLAMTAKIWPSMILGGLTTIIGYVALGNSGYPGFQQVAVFATSGILISLLLTRFVLPQLMTDVNTKTLRVPLINSWSGFSQKYRIWLLGGLVLLITLASLNLHSLLWMQDMQELTPELNYLKIKDKQIRERMTSIEPGRFVMITGDNIELALQKAEQVYPVLDQLKKTTELTDYFGLYPWILSEQQQKINQSLLNSFLTEDNQLKWQLALKTAGLSVRKLGQLDYTNTQTLSFGLLMASPVSKVIDSRIVNGAKQTIIMIWLGQHQPQAVQLALKDIQGAQYFSQREMLNNMTKKYTERAQVLLMLGVVVIVLLLLARYKSIVKTTQTLLPAVLASFIILIIWSFTGEAISFLHLVGFLLVIAICVDYGIFYQENRGGDSHLTYQAMAVSMLTSAVAFGSLIAAESMALRILSGVVALGVFIGFVLCPVIIKRDDNDQVSH